MPELTDKLSGLLSDPESASKLARIAALLGSSLDQEEDEEAQEQAERVEEGVFGGKGDMAAILLKAMPLISEFAASDNDPKVQLLYALRPYLTGERLERLEDAVLLLKLSRIAGSAMELFGSEA
ncbi:MAG: hypothetical protein GXX99_05800 [Clostridiales bacterium]|nr:hypothetical protein [Clostridiales bacterium]